MAATAARRKGGESAGYLSEFVVRQVTAWGYKDVCVHTDRGPSIVAFVEKGVKQRSVRTVLEHGAR